MYYLIALIIVIIGTVVEVVVTHTTTVPHIASVALLWLVAGFYGGNMFISGLQHIFNSKNIARSIGWESNGFQKELGWFSVGLGVSGLLAVFWQGIYLVGPAAVGSVFLLGAALVHREDMRKRRNFHPGNAGIIFYMDIIVPLLTLVVILLATPWR
jgi:hypothetical protein